MLSNFGFTCQKADFEGDVLLAKFENVLSIDGDFFFHHKVKRFFNFSDGLDKPGKLFLIDACVVKSQLTRSGWSLLGIVSGNDYSKLPGVAAGRAYNTISRLEETKQTLTEFCKAMKCPERYAFDIDQQV